MYDVLVIGAGPAGSSAAYHASRAGLRVLLIDRKHFPRSKTCGDAVVPRALAAISRMGVQNVGGHIVRGVRINHRKRSRFEDYAQQEWPYHGVVVPRLTLDSVLLSRARDAGADFGVGYAQHLVMEDGRAVGATIQTETGVRVVRARTLIAATGAGLHSGLLCQGIRTRPVWGIAGRTYVELDGDAGDELEVYFPVLHEGRLLSGYGWVFPIGSRCVNVGVGVFRTARERQLSLHDLVEHFIATRMRSDHRWHRARRLGPIVSGAISVGPELASPPGLLPVGDLAGLANPFTGEGIAAAIESGELVAQAIVTAGEGATVSYHAELQRRLRSQFSLRSAVAAAHARPLLLGRGADLLTAPGGTIVSTLRHLMLDIPQSRTTPNVADDTTLHRAISDVRTDIVLTIHRLRPLFAEMADRLMAERRLGFGWYAGLAAAVRCGLASRETQLVRTRCVVVALELSNLVASLHRELPSAACQPRPQNGIWGRQTLSLMLADCFTAAALRVLYELPAPWARVLGIALQRKFRHAAAARSTLTVSPIPDAERELFLLAARAGLSTTHRAALPDVVTAVATVLASLRKQPRSLHAGRVGVLRQKLTRMPHPSARHLATLLRIASDDLSASAGGIGAPASAKNASVGLREFL